MERKLLTGLMLLAFGMNITANETFDGFKAKAQFVFNSAKTAIYGEEVEAPKKGRFVTRHLDQMPVWVPEVAVETPEVAVETPEVAVETPEVAVETPEVIATDVAKPTRKGWAGVKLASAKTFASNLNANHGTGIYNDGIIAGAKNNKLKAGVHATLAAAVVASFGYGLFKGAKALYNWATTNLDAKLEKLKAEGKKDEAQALVVEAIKAGKIATDDAVLRSYRGRCGFTTPQELRSSLDAFKAALVAK